jgi:cation transport regulator ChaC
VMQVGKSYGHSNLAIFAYGSLLSDPGEKILPHIIARVPYPMPWPIEYARRAKLRGDGPTLVLHKTGGIVRGQLLVLDIQKSALDELMEWLWQREGEPPRERLKQTACGDFGCVLYCDLESNLRNEEINAESLTGFAIESVHKNPTRNAINYLAQNIEQGIITPLTYAYRDAVLHRVEQWT